MTDLGRMTGRVAELLEQRLRLRGPTLGVLVRKAGRRLPRKVRRAAQELAEVEALAQHPKGRMMVDMIRATAAYDICMAHLKPLGSGARWKALALDLVTSLALLVLILGVAGVCILVWRGFL